MSASFKSAALHKSAGRTRTHSVGFAQQRSSGATRAAARTESGWERRH
jgi:hypothetical protein